MTKQVLINPSTGKKWYREETPSRKWTQCKIIEPIEYFWSWENDAYYGSFRKYDCGFGIGGGPYAVIGISAVDETAKHDWRDFQRIKNDLVGEEWEAVELYPAESRLIDPSNRFYLWCVPKGVFTFGLPGTERKVLKASESDAPQRPFHDE